MLFVAGNGRSLKKSVDEDISREKSDYVDYYQNNEYDYSENYYSDDAAEEYYDYNDRYSSGEATEDEVDYDTIHSKVPFHKSQISYKEAIYLPSLYTPSGKQDKTILQRNRLRDIFLTIRRQCGGGQRGYQQGLCQYFFRR